MLNFFNKNVKIEEKNDKVYYRFGKKITPGLEEILILLSEDHYADTLFDDSLVINVKGTQFKPFKIRIEETDACVLQEKYLLIFEDRFYLEAFLDELIFIIEEITNVPIEKRTTSPKKDVVLGEETERKPIKITEDKSN